jgi:hypothetical protein
VVAAHFNMVYETGARTMFARCADRITKNAWRKMGYEIIADFAVLDVRDWHNVDR